MALSTNDFSLEKLNSVEVFEKASNQSFIRESGNSDVDIRIELDTTPIAYAMLCSMLATIKCLNGNLSLLLENRGAYK
ncbi:hypothetical protein [Oceanobacillus piezotolerans]|uniref:hypothetical protein n=1 Tax=Oceanobacillus piezotolerans TaxID=2448030 RepID=UPI00165757FA|nr:hypothetical protein [Oceanobacillus piezotolerans]